MSFQLMCQPLFVAPPPANRLSPLFGVPDGCPRKTGSSVEPKMTASCITTTPPLSPDSCKGNSDSSQCLRPSSPCSSYAMNATIVAVDKDKNSRHAVKWAIENLASRNLNIILVHVKIKQLLYPGFGNEGPQEGFDGELRDLFTLYRGYSARKSVQMREVILEEREVVKGLLDYIANNYVANVVLGASSRNALSRKLKNTDVSASLMKSAPDFCSVYVISKGKVLSTRQARGVVSTSIPPRQPSPRGRSPIASQAEYDNASRMASRRPRHKSMGSDMLNISNEKIRVPVVNLSVDAIDFRAPRGRDSISDCSDISGSAPSQGSMDLDDEKLDFASWGGSDTSLSQSSRELEVEMKRLKLELKQTMDMYSMACKEAITAKRKAEQLHQMKLEEEQRVEEARMAEETALATAEMERAKCKAAIDAAEKAQKLAEMEGLRRKQAEMKARQEAQEKDRALTALHQNNARYRKYSIEEIEASTDKFSKSNKIGEGGYGPVYKGKLNHTPVAIKVLRPDAAQGKRQFHQEIEVLSSMRHPNMVLLLGACLEYGCLVYEFMDFGSLEDRLLRRGNTPPLSWRKRFDIAAEIATALLFMHQAKPEPLVHRDLKPANILLDRNLKSKISDVGLARLVPPSVAENVTQYHVTSAAGTFCYIDPEYQQTGKLTTKSDVYSLGIMLLQIVTAKSPMGLSHHVQSAIEKEKFEEMLDPSVTDWPVEEALAFVKLALACAELRKKDRPDLGTVVLPELNRLRDFGRNNSNSSQGRGHAGGHTVGSGGGNYTPRSQPSSPLPGGREVSIASTQSADHETRD